MARRRKSSPHVSLFSLVMVGALLVALVAGIWKLYNPHGAKELLPLPAYLEAPASFSGNSYRVEVVVINRLAQNEKGTTYTCAAGEHPLAIIVPQEVMPQYRIEKGQLLYIDLRLSNDGAAIATTIAKK